MENQPLDILINIFGHFEPIDVIRVTQTSKNYRELIHNENFWRRLVSLHYGATDKIGTWYTTYIIKSFYSSIFVVIINTAPNDDDDDDDDDDNDDNETFIVFRKRSNALKYIFNYLIEKNNYDVDMLNQAINRLTYPPNYDIDIANYYATFNRLPNRPQDQPVIDQLKQHLLEVYYENIDDLFDFISDLNLDYSIDLLELPITDF